MSDVVRVVERGRPGPPGPYRVENSYSREGVVPTPLVSPFHWYIPYASKLMVWSAYSNTAPVGASLVIQLMRNDVTVLDTLTIPIGVKAATNSPGFSVAANSALSLNLSSGLPLCGAADLVVTVGLQHVE